MSYTQNSLKEHAETILDGLSPWELNKLATDETYRIGWAAAVVEKNGPHIKGQFLAMMVLRFAQIITNSVAFVDKLYQRQLYALTTANVRREPLSADQFKVYMNQRNVANNADQLHPAPGAIADILGIFPSNPNSRTERIGTYNVVAINTLAYYASKGNTDIIADLYFGEIYKKHEDESFLRGDFWLNATKDRYYHALKALDAKNGVIWVDYAEVKPARLTMYEQEQGINVIAEVRARIVGDKKWDYAPRTLVKLSMSVEIPNCIGNVDIIYYRLG